MRIFIGLNALGRFKQPTALNHDENPYIWWMNGLFCLDCVEGCSIQWIRADINADLSSTMELLVKSCLERVENAKKNTTCLNPHT
jgi:hypothetical protein